ncbi:hypothetical protein OG884_20155 [Streptosporangium sp. NBC_01755]|uniref:hypothetical protein n=1 Tax=unclassified Streptosporangium TaxID=2632669 RepID=UPI002DDB0B9D|nr:MULTISPECIES: hypothetical protein [unclassified Streptosporangium]WSA24706.1 hypothetical protein OIE13_27755 [Streptosporangium sp. NBC_01810]WSC97217.1 hypothetical protein OG884_20155 [Streptosporangium sp. NBC_01755]
MSEPPKDDALADSLAEALAAQQQLDAFTARHRRPSVDELVEWMLEKPALPRTQYPTPEEST